MSGPRPPSVPLFATCSATGLRAIRSNGGFFASEVETRSGSHSSTDTLRRKALANCKSSASTQSHDHKLWARATGKE